MPESSTCFRVKGSFKEVENIKDLAADGCGFQKAQRFGSWAGTNRGMCNIGIRNDEK